MLLRQTKRVKAALALAVLVLLPANLAAADPNCQDLIKQLDDPNWRARQSACKLLGKQCTDDPNVPLVLTKMLEDGDTLVRYAAAWALEQFGPAAEGTEPNLVRVLDQDYIGAAASKALQHLGSSALTTLIQVVVDENEPNSLRIAALGVLAEFGPDANGVLGDLIGLLDSNLPSTDMTIAVCHAIGEQGCYAEPATPALLQDCNSEDSLIRLEAARTLGKIGPLDVDQVRELIGKLENEEERLRGIADSNDCTYWSVRFGATGPEQHRCSRVETEIVRSLEKLQKHLCWNDAKSVVMPVLMEVLEYAHPQCLASGWHWLHEGIYCPYRHVYIAAAEGLRFYGPKAQSAIPVIEQLLEFECRGDRMRRALDAIQNPCLFLDPPILSAVEQGPGVAWEGAVAKLLVNREEFVKPGNPDCSDPYDPNNPNIVVVLRIKHNTLTQAQLEMMFPNAIKRWVDFKDKVGWAEPEEGPFATVAAKIPAPRVGEEESWEATIDIPKIEYSTFCAWDKSRCTRSGHIWPVSVIWSDAGCIE